MSEELKLLLCPFCESAAEAITHIKKSKRVTRCRNPNCEIFGIFVDIRKWNRRPAPARELSQDDIDQLILSHYMMEYQYPTQNQCREFARAVLLARGKQ